MKSPALPLKPAAAFPPALLSGSRLFPLLLSLAFLSASARGAAAPDAWPGFRGPEGTAICPASSVPPSFTEKDFNWKIPLTGKGHSSPVIWGGSIFLTVAESDQTRHVLAFAIKDGRELWRWTDGFTAHNKNQLNEFTSSSPCVDRDRVYVFWTSGAESEALALTHAGATAWRTTLGTFHGDHGSASSPVLYADVLFVFWDDADKKQTEYAGLNPQNGAFLWRKPIPWPELGRELKTSYSTPAVRTTSKGRAEVIVTSMIFGVQSFDLRTGELLWDYTPQVKERTVGSPVVADDIVFATWGSGNGAKEHVALFPGTETASGKAEVAWRHTKPNGSPDNKGFPYVSTPVAHQGVLYFWADSGLLSALQARTGATIYGPERVNGQYFSSPILIGEHLYCGNRDLNEMVVAKAGPKFELVSRNPLGAGVNATPAVAHGTLFIRTDTHLISVGGL